MKATPGVTANAERDLIMDSERGGCISPNCRLSTLDELSMECSKGNRPASSLSECSDCIPMVCLCAPVWDILPYRI